MPTPDNAHMDPLPALAASGTSIMPFALLGTVGVFFGVLAVIGIFVVVVVANRADPDPAGRRPLTVYCFGVSFFSVFAILFGSFGIVYCCLIIALYFAPKIGFIAQIERQEILLCVKALKRGAKN